MLSGHLLDIFLGVLHEVCSEYSDKSERSDYAYCRSQYHNTLQDMLVRHA